MSEKNIESTNEKMEDAFPQKLPEPTFAPFFTAMGGALICWGFISSWYLSVSGVLTLAWGLFIWIKNLLDEEDER